MTTMVFHPIAARIIAGETVCPSEISSFNAQQVASRDRGRARRGVHPAKGCHVKQCGHNVGNDADFVRTVTAEAIQNCTCGRH